MSISCKNVLLLYLFCLCSCGSVKNQYPYRFDRGYIVSDLELEKIKIRANHDMRSAEKLGNYYAQKEDFENSVFWLKRAALLGSKTAPETLKSIEKLQKESLEFRKISP